LQPIKQSFMNNRLATLSIKHDIMLKKSMIKAMFMGKKMRFGAGQMKKD